MDNNLPLYGLDRFPFLFGNLVNIHMSSTVSTLPEHSDKAHDIEDIRISRVRTGSSLYIGEFWQRMWGMWSLRAKGEPVIYSGVPTTAKAGASDEIILCRLRSNHLER